MRLKHHMYWANTSVVDEDKAWKNRLVYERNSIATNYTICTDLSYIYSICLQARTRCLPLAYLLYKTSARFHAVKNFQQNGNFLTVCSRAQNQRCRDKCSLFPMQDLLSQGSRKQPLEFRTFRLAILNQLL